MTFSLSVIKNFVLKTNVLFVSKYYFYGLIKKTWKFKTGEIIKVSSFDYIFEQNLSVVDFGNTEAKFDFDTTTTEIGCLGLIFASFVPMTVVRKEFKIFTTNENNKQLKSVYIQLNQVELNHLMDFIRKSR